MLWAHFFRFEQNNSDIYFYYLFIKNLAHE